MCMCMCVCVRNGRGGGIIGRNEEEEERRTVSPPPPHPLTRPPAPTQAAPQRSPRYTTAHRGSTSPHVALPSYTAAGISALGAWVDGWMEEGEGKR